MTTPNTPTVADDMDFEDYVHTMQMCREEVKRYFKYDTDKTDLWFKTVNPNLGGLRPNQMFELGRAEKLLEWIKNSIGENIL